MLPIKTMEFGPDIRNVQIYSRFLRTIPGKSFIKNNSNKFNNFCREKKRKSFEDAGGLLLTFKHIYKH